MSADDRDQVFANIRAALAKRGAPRAVRPEIAPTRIVATRRLTGSDDSWELFARNFVGVRGSPCRSLTELIALLRQHDAKRGYCDPALRQALGNPLAAEGYEIVYAFDRAEIDKIAFGITRAAGAIAETGSIILNDRTTSNRLGALAPWIHVAVVKPSTIHRTLGDAIAAFGDDPNIILVTGPSKTADIEGILIEGVHGPGVQVALRWE